MTKIEKLEKLLEMLGITFSELRKMNEAQIKAIEIEYRHRYNENINISFCF